MAILAANCPCCGRDIGFDENVKEYTCIFCGAKLITATLVKERLDSERHTGYERYRKGDADDVYHHANAGLVVRQRSENEPEFGYSFYRGSNMPGLPGLRPTEGASASEPEAEQKPAEPEKKEEPELTEEEIRIQLMRKAEFKQELRDTVKEIDTLRDRRERFTSQLKTCKILLILGLVLVAFAAAVIIIFDGAENMTSRFIIAGSLAFLGVLTLILSEVKKNGVKKQQKKLEEDIGEKKEKRDILIGRLNKINMKLHIHSDEEQ